jgi:hypothetical protein
MVSQEPPSEDAGSRKRAWFFQGMGLAALVLIGVYSMGGLELEHSLKPSGHDAALAFHPAEPGVRTGGLRPMKTPAMAAGPEAASVLDAPEAKTTGYVNELPAGGDASNAMSLASERHDAAMEDAKEATRRHDRAVALASMRHDKAVALASMRHDEAVALAERVALNDIAAVALASERHDKAVTEAKRSAANGVKLFFKHPRASICMRATTAMESEGDPASMCMLATTAMKSPGDAGQLASVFTVMPAEEQKQVQALKIDVLTKAKSMPGVTAPLDFFDPLGFCSDCSEGKLCFYREVEVKHGRVAMLASLGFLVGEQFHPLWGGNIDIPSYIAFQQTPLQHNAFLPIN